MKKMKRNLVLIVCCMFAVGMITMTGCKKKDTTVDNDTSGATDVSLAENTSNDVVNIGAQASELGSTASYRIANDEGLLSTCATVVINTTTKIMTVTFNGPCLDGRTRTGKLIYDYSGSAPGANHYRDPGFSFTVSDSAYTVDGNAINIISKKVTNTTPSGFNYQTKNETWSISANISIVKANGAGTVTWTCNRTTTLLNTSSVYPPSDTSNDVTPINWLAARVQIDGNASGTRANGETFTATATAMVRDFTCTPAGYHRHPFISGELDYAPAGKAVRYINFGTGACDMDAVVTINGVAYNIVLP
jgi:hypothetical protein